MRVVSTARWARGVLAGVGRHEMEEVIWRAMCYDFHVLPCVCLRVYPDCARGFCTIVC